MKSSFALLPILLCVFVCLPAFCEPVSEITIQLGSERGDGHGRTIPSVTSRSRTSDGKEKIGDYGVVIKDFAIIRKTPSAGATSRGVVPVNETVVIQTTKGNYMGVLLEDGTTGWIESSEIRVVPLEVFARRTGMPGGLTGYDSNKVPYSEIINFAKEYSRTPYVFGGTSITRGMDCSAFVRDIFRKLGVSLPRTAREQAAVGTEIAKDPAVMQAGDRVYFRYKNSYIDHAGIYVGNGYYIHCNSGKHGVSVDELFVPRTLSKLVTVRRL